jgi:hypothetical protein
VRPSENGANLGPRADTFDRSPTTGMLAQRECRLSAGSDEPRAAWYAERIMSERAKKLLEEARLLPVEERRKVVEAMLEMDVEDDDDGVVEDPADARARETEIKRRVQGIVDGTAELIDEDIVRAELNRRRMHKSA